MTTYIHKLVVADLPVDTPIQVIPYDSQTRINLDDPAIRAMTDLKQNRAITVKPEDTIDFAMQLMKQVGVRLLVVVDDNNTIAGLITARDITGEKPVTVTTGERIRREEILVSHVMTPRSRMDAFDIKGVEHATVRDVVVQLHNDGLQHGIVIEYTPDGDCFIRGIFSITQIGRLLGNEIPVEGHIPSFAEIEQLIV